MKRIVIIFFNDLKRRIKNPVTILIMLLIPFAMTFIMGKIFSPKENKLPAIKVLVADNDQNFLSQFVLASFHIPQVKEMFNLAEVSTQDGLRLMKRGKASAFIIVPKRFTQQVLNGSSQAITLIKNPSEEFFPVIVEELMRTNALIISGIIEIFGPEIEAIKPLLRIPLEKLTMPDLFPVGHRLKEKVIRLKTFLNPLIINLKQKEIEVKKKKVQVNLFAFILPAISIMFILFIVEMIMRDILAEKEDGKIQRMMFSPIKPFELIMGRIISGWIMGILVNMIVIIMGIVFFNINWGNPFVLLLFISVSTFWVASFFALINSLLKNRNQANIVLTPIILIFSAFGGSMIQVEQLPTYLHPVSFCTFNHWFIKGINAIRENQFPLLELTIIFVSSCLLFSLAAIRLEKKIKT